MSQPIASRSAGVKAASKSRRTSSEVAISISRSTSATSASADEPAFSSFEASLIPR